MACFLYDALKGERLEAYKSQAKQILKKLGSQNVGSKLRMRVEAGEYHFNYSISDGICYLVLTEKNFPKKLAFSYLTEIQDGFVAELKHDHGVAWLDKINTAARPYAFIKFDKFIQMKRREFDDPSSRQNMNRLTSDLSDISDIMRSNITDVLDRGRALDDMSRTSASLVDESKKFQAWSRKLNLMEMWRQYAPLIAVGFVMLLLFWYKFLW